MAFILKKYKRLNGIKKEASPYYYIRYQANGKVADYSTKSRNYEVARKIRNKIEDDLALGKFDLIPISSSLTVEEWRNEFFENKATQIKKGDFAESSFDRYQRSIGKFLESFNDVKNMRQFTVEHIKKYERKRLDEISSNTVLNELTHIKVFFSECWELHKIPSPMEDFQVGEQDKKPPNIYSQDEIRKFLPVENKRNRAMLLLDLQAGLRKWEMGSRRWKHIDFERNVIWIRKEGGFNPKDRDDRSIPLKPETKEALLKWKEESRYNKEEDFIFPNSKGKEFIANVKNKLGRTRQVSKFDVVMLKVLKKVGVKGHCQKFRDTFASYSLGVGVPPQNIQQWLGHSDFKTTQHYLNYLPKAIEPDIRKLFEWKG